MGTHYENRSTILYIFICIFTIVAYHLSSQIETFELFETILRISLFYCRKHVRYSSFRKTHNSIYSENCSNISSSYKSQNHPFILPSIVHLRHSPMYRHAIYTRLAQICSRANRICFGIFLPHTTIISDAVDLHYLGFYCCKSFRKLSATIMSSEEIGTYNLDEKY